MIPEHLSMAGDDHYLDSLIDEAGSGASSADMRPFSHVKVEKDKDQNVFILEANQDSVDSDERHKTIAEQLVRAFTDYDDFVGSTYYKHMRLFKYYTLLTAALKDP